MVISLNVLHDLSIHCSAGMSNGGSFILLHLEGDVSVDGQLSVDFLALSVLSLEILDLAVDFDSGTSMQQGQFISKNFTCDRVEELGNRFPSDKAPGMVLHIRTKRINPGHEVRVKIVSNFSHGI